MFFIFLFYSLGNVGFQIGELEYRIEHESISLKEEKQLMRDIKQLESTRSQVCANTVLQQELTESLGLKENIQDQYKVHCKFFCNVSYHIS